VVVCTNAPADALPAAEAAQLYRGRWMVEIFFKGLKSGQGLEVWSRHRTNANAILCMAYSHLILAVLSLNLWRVLGRIVSLE
jgi:IS4 transposase